MDGQIGDKLPEIEAIARANMRSTPDTAAIAHVSRLEP